MKNLVVAIDGPAGSGKSSISKIVAKSLGFTHIDTGAMYRAVTLEALKRKIDLDNEAEYTFIQDLSVVYTAGKTYLNGVDVSAEIRTSEVTNNVSAVSRIPSVRERMVFFQRGCREYGNILMDGRDIGTVVFPDADLKVFLTASAEERAKRRCEENKLVGLESNYDIILEEIKARDYKDSHRAIAPLKKADDAVLLDTTSMSIDEVSTEIIKLINERLKNMENDFASMLDASFKKIRKGDTVKGEVVSIIDERTIAISLEAFTEGIMHLDHFTKDRSITSFNGVVEIGQVLECTVTSVTEEHIYLSRLNKLADEAFAKVQALKDEDATIEVEILAEVANNKGYTCRFGEVSAFMPKSQAGSGVAPKAKVEAKIIEVDEARKKIVVSHRVIEQAEFAANKTAEYDAIEVGATLKGTIVKVEKYGALVKFNYITGLLKVSEVSHDFIDITKELTVGDEIEVKVLSKENGKLELSRKALVKSAFTVFAEAHTVGETIKGKVTNKLPAGLLIEVAPKVKGLLHRSEFSHNPNDNYASYVKIDDEVEVAILAIDAEKERVSLSRKALMDNPWTRVEAKEGDITEVTVNEIVAKGLRVSAFGVDAFVPISEATSERVDDLKKYFNVGDKAEAEVLTIIPKEWKLVLSIRRVLRAKERAEYSKYMKNEEASTSIGDIADLNK